MKIHEGVVEVLQAYADNLIAQGDRFMTTNQKNDKYLDVKKVQNNKHKRRILLMWIGEVIDAVIEDIKYGDDKDLSIEKKLKGMHTILLKESSDFDTISLVNILAFEILDLLNDQIDETDHTISYND
ncbi:MAG: hypothetical protein B6244_04320 [Candidatus Cloacimonetes bacterium 4572_55]|nr:MAG: hypothetical protein B6244_04320 [Candidatus Cloacimonetes bacterium 4572_55]